MFQIQMFAGKVDSNTFVKNLTLMMDLKETVWGKMFVMTMGSFQFFIKIVTLTCVLLVEVHVFQICAPSSISCLVSAAVPHVPITNTLPPSHSKLANTGIGVHRQVPQIRARPPPPPKRSVTNNKFV